MRKVLISLEEAMAGRVSIFVLIYRDGAGGRVHSCRHVLVCIYVCARMCEGMKARRWLRLVGQ